MRRSVSRQSQDSRRTRRRTNSGVSVTEAEFQGLQLVDDYRDTILPSVAVQEAGDITALPTSDAQASSADYLTPDFDTASYSSSLNVRFLCCSYSHLCMRPTSGIAAVFPVMRIAVQMLI